jgi:hypothetical protein
VAPADNDEGFVIGFPALVRAVPFKDDPELACGFYGHRLKLYRATQPHKGFRILLDIGERVPQGAFRICQ